MVGLETRLGSDAPLLDLLLLLDNASADDEYPARPDPMCLLPAADRRRPEWQRIAEVCRGFRSRSPGMMADVTAIWLEFDLDRVSTASAGVRLPLPSVFVGIRDQRGLMPAGELACRYATQLIAAVEMLIGAPLASGRRRRLERMVHATADLAEGYHVGIMLSRGADLIRLCVRRAPVPAVLDRLQGAGWPGDAGRISSKLDAYFGIAHDPIVHVDIGDVIGSAIGFDLCLAPSFLVGQPRDEPRWGRLLDTLVSAGLVTAAKCDAFLSWPGAARVIDHDRPERETACRPAYLIRGLNHVKILCGAQGTLSAKGYFGYLHLEQGPAIPVPTRA